MALLRVAAIDKEMSRLRSSLQEIVSLLDRQRADLAALGALIEADRARPAKLGASGGETAESRRKRRHRNERAYAELTRTLEWDQADALHLSAELQRRTVEFAEQRQALLAHVSPPLPGLYETALREGLRPAVAPAPDGACSACGLPLEAAARRRLVEGGRVVPCPACARLLYDPVWVEMNVPPTLRPVVKARP